MKKIIFNVDPYTFTGSAIIIGLVLTQELSTSEQDSIGNWLQLIGLIMQTYASQTATLDTVKTVEETNNNVDIETIKKAIKIIEKRLKTIEKDAKTTSTSSTL